LFSSLGDKGSLLILNEVTNEVSIVPKHLQTLAGYQVVLCREPLVFLVGVPPTTGQTLCTPAMITLTLRPSERFLLLPLHYK
jgi:hypothetical protein